MFIQYVFRGFCKTCFAMKWITVKHLFYKYMYFFKHIYYLEFIQCVYTVCFIYLVYLSTNHV